MVHSLEHGILLSHAKVIIEAALNEGRKLKLKPLSIVVLDPGGHMIAFPREDGSSTLRPQIAIAKASGALALGVSSRTIAEMGIDRPAFIAAAAGLSASGLIPAAGGVLVRDSEGRVTGAVGVTGDTSDNDEICALAGVAAAELRT